MFNHPDKLRIQLTWFVTTIILALVVYEVYSGITFRKVGIPGLFEIEFAESRSIYDSAKHQDVSSFRENMNNCDIANAWNIVQSHRGDVTDAMDDILSYQELVLQIGCIQHPYILDLHGKQNLNRFVITVTGEHASNASMGEIYHYKEFTTTLDVGGNLRHVSWRARRPANSREDWELLDEK